jgi:hypothetical protein
MGVLLESIINDPGVVVVGAMAVIAMAMLAKLWQASGKSKGE